MKIVLKLSNEWPGKEINLTPTVVDFPHPASDGYEEEMAELMFTVYGNLDRVLRSVNN